MSPSKKSMAELIQLYQTKNPARQFKPENYLDIPRVLGAEFSIDMNRLVCQHQQHVASAYMRRIRRDKIQQRNSHFQKVQNIPMKIKRVAVGPDYTDPYTNLKKRFPKLGQDDKIQVARKPQYPHMVGSTKYVPHNSLAPHITLFKMNPAAASQGQNGGPAGTNNTNNGKTSKTGRVEDELPFSLSPRRAKPIKLHWDESPRKVRKRFSVDMSAPNTKVKEIQDSSSNDSTPRCPTNSPRNAFWSFNVPRELNNSKPKSHVSSIPCGKQALAAISSVQKYNKPLPAIMVKV